MGPANQLPAGQTSQTIIYATRTHAQLAQVSACLPCIPEPGISDHSGHVPGYHVSQVVRELKSTSYAPRVAILGSREQFCVHPEVRQYTGSLQNRKCGTLTSDHRCQ